MKGLDTAQITTGKAQDIVDAGFEAVGIYLREDRAPKEMVDELLSVGLQIWSIYEKGRPIETGYFSTEQGEIDGDRAVAYANVLGQTSGSQIYATADYDPSEDDVNGPITDYMTAFHAKVRAAGYLASIYSSGRCCRMLIEKGIAHTGWLSESTGFAEHEDFTPNASIVQSVGSTHTGLNADLDDIPDPVVAGLWTAGGA